MRLPPLQWGDSQIIARAKQPRSSNLELYRIVCMLMIVAHHFVMNSGLADSDGPLMVNYTSEKSIFLSLFGAWGKTGINCFVMITGYFMCTSKITVKKFAKMMGQIYLYKVVLFLVFLLAGYEIVTLKRIVMLIMPFWGFSNGFLPCFIAFWLTIPFLTILVQNMNKRQHQLLLLVALGFYTIIGSVPTFNITFNYITWFGIIFFLASYIRLYPHPVFYNKKLWGWLTLISVILAMTSIVCLRLFLGNYSYEFVEDSNKIFAVAIGVSSFMWFKNMNIKYSKIINAFGAATFGVLLIHAGSDAMRTWLWRDAVDCVGFYELPLGSLIMCSVGVVLVIFIVCNLIDQLRIATLEKWFFKWYDKKYAEKAEAIVGRIINGKQKANL